MAHKEALNLTDEISLACELRLESSLEDKYWWHPHYPVPMNGEGSVVGGESAGLVCRDSRNSNFFQLEHHVTHVNVVVWCLRVSRELARGVYRESKNCSRSALRMLHLYEYLYEIERVIAERKAIASTVLTSAVQLVGVAR